MFGQLLEFQFFRPLRMYTYAQLVYYVLCVLIIRNCMVSRPVGINKCTYRTSFYLLLSPHHHQISPSFWALGIVASFLYKTPNEVPPHPSSNTDYIRLFSPRSAPSKIRDSLMQMRYFFENRSREFWTLLQTSFH
jgi:hypothetical protein